MAEPLVRKDGEEWALCEGCNERHPTKKELYDVIAGRIEVEEATLLLSVTPREWAAIEAALQHFTLTMKGLDNDSFKWCYKVTNEIRSRIEAQLE